MDYSLKKQHPPNFYKLLKLLYLQERFAAGSVIIASF